MKKPAGVIVIAVIMFLTGLVSIMGGLHSIALGANSTGVFNMVFGFVYFYVGVTLLQMTERGRKGAIGLSGIQLLRGGIMLAGVVVGLRARTTPLTASQMGLLVILPLTPIIIPVFMLKYLLNPETKTVFVPNTAS